MRDPISEQRLESLHPKVRQDFKNFIEDAEAALNITIRITEALRTFKQQQAYYDQGRTKPGSIITNAKPGQSYHQYGLAADIAVFFNIVNDTAKKELNWNYPYELLKPFAAKYGITWGGDFPGKFKDRPHFEKKMNYTWPTLLRLYKVKYFIPGTTYVIL